MGSEAVSEKCPTCARRPSERISEPVFSGGGLKVTHEICGDPFHDLADRAPEMHALLVDFGSGDKASNCHCTATDTEWGDLICNPCRARAFLSQPKKAGAAVVGDADDADPDAEKCDGCGEPATCHDADDVPLCRPCADAMVADHLRDATKKVDEPRCDKCGSSIGVYTFEGWGGRMACMECVKRAFEPAPSLGGAASEAGSAHIAERTATHARESTAWEECARDVTLRDGRDGDLLRYGFSRGWDEQTRALDALRAALRKISNAAGDCEWSCGRCTAHGYSLGTRCMRELARSALAAATPETKEKDTDA